MHIQRGDDRQYFSQPIAEQSTLGQNVQIFNQVLNAGVSISQKANESDLASKQIDLSSEWYKKNNEINLKYQADPTNPQRDIELNEAFDKLSEKYNVNPTLEKQWRDTKKTIFDRTKLYNIQWQEKQQQSNAQTNLSNGYKQSLDQMSMLGKNGANIDDVRLIYANSHDALKKAATPILGEFVTNEALKNFSHDALTEYIDGLMTNNPALALKLLSNESVIKDLDNAQTIEKLKQSAQNKLLKKTEIDAVDRIANLINTNSELLNKAFDGTITTKEAQQILSNKNVDKTMRTILSAMLGFSTKSDYYVDIDSGKLIKQEEKQKQKSQKSETLENPEYSELIIGNKKWTFLTEKGKVRQPTTNEKDEITNELFLQGSRLLNGIENKTPQDTIRQIAKFQSQVAQARYFGIDKGDYNKLMNDFVLPATINIQNEAKNYTDRAHWYGHNFYGYKQIDDYFKSKFSDDKAENIKERDKEQALASVYYWSSLNNLCSQRGISMSDLKNLSGTEKASIYSKAAKNAIEQTKANSSNPQLWFRAANPQYVSTIRSILPNQNANNVITNIAVSSMANPSMSESDFNKLVDKEIKNEYAKMRTSNKTVVFNDNTKYDEIINKYAMLYGVDPLLIKSIIKQESGFNPNARSSAGAGGLMQLMPKTASSLGVKNLYDPKQNISAGTKYFAFLLNKFNGDVPLALAAYNAGPTAVAKYDNKIPPYKETQKYVKNIMETYNSIKG
jgi:soluble lytic murein transglycosylase-like protein